MKNPTVSIITATWMRPHYIGMAIRSAINQTFEDWELIVIDDGSPDNTAAVIAEWQKKDERIKYIRVARAGRIGVVSNAGLRLAKGEFIAILDDDDYWIDNRKLEKQVAFFREHPDYIACGGWFTVVNAKGEETGRIRKPTSDRAIRRVMLSANGIANSTSTFRRVEAGFYDESLPQFADWEFFLKLGTKGKLCNFPEYFLAYRMWERGASFMYQSQNADTAVTIVKRYRHDYPGYAKAIFLARLYQGYSRLPLWIRKGTNAFLSRLKKALFSK